jgi:hypothetical protein
VVSLGHAELIELYEIRESLEGMACRLAAERMSQAEIDELRRVLDTHERDAAFQAGRATTSRKATRLPLPDHSGQRQPDPDKMLCGELYQLVRMYRIQFSPRPTGHARPLPSTTAFSTPSPTATANWPNS